MAIVPSRTHHNLVWQINTHRPVWLTADCHCAAHGYSAKIEQVGQSAMTGKRINFCRTPSIVDQCHPSKIDACVDINLQRPRRSLLRYDLPGLVAKPARALRGRGRRQDKWCRNGGQSRKKTG